jgi:tRNA(Arg) A34 adenosine deaminase TadA
LLGERRKRMKYPPVTLRLPDWIGKLIGNPDLAYPDVEDRMRLAVKLSRESIHRGTGGPFGAAIFDRETNRLLAPGVNLVMASGYSFAHAEMVAIMVAQQLVGDFDLGGEGQPPYELVASTEPCSMCFGAVPWSGVRHLICGARGEDAEAVGFDEGTKPAEWGRTLEERGITVERDVLRDEAASVLREYIERGGEIYNARRGG